MWVMERWIKFNGYRNVYSIYETSYHYWQEYIIAIGKLSYCSVLCLIVLI